MTGTTVMPTSGGGGENSTNSTTTYYEAYIPHEIQIVLEASAFRSLVGHLQERSDDVANIDLMTLVGFCRNCLAKWIVVEARRLKSHAMKSMVHRSNSMEERSTKSHVIELKILDVIGYDEAAEDVYGTSYGEWKKLHQKKATEEQMKAYKASEHRWAKHDDALLQTNNRDGLLGNDMQHIIFDKNFMRTYVPMELQTRLYSGAFRSLCKHLQQRSGDVSNIDLMTLSGFCRNCLAKWLVMAARRRSIFVDKNMSNVLNAFGYDEAAEVVYGCTYPEWKKRHQKKATDAQMEAYNASMPMHAQHDKEVLATFFDKDAIMSTFSPVTAEGGRAAGAADVGGRGGGGGEGGPVAGTGSSGGNPLLSDVCCQDVDSLGAGNNAGASCPLPSSSSSTTSPAAQPSPPMFRGSLSVKVGVLTVSDRASSNEYESGDLSGPAVEVAVRNEVSKLNSNNVGDGGGGVLKSNVTCSVVRRSIVPDEIQDITETLQQWCEKGSEEERCNLILTTGGTGFAPRDVTPEATRLVLHKECRGLMSWVSVVCSSNQPLASLSRGTAGVRNRTLIVNLPGSPRGAAEVTEVLFPLVVHALHDMEK